MNPKRRYLTNLLGGLGLLAGCRADSDLLDDLIAHQGTYVTYYESPSLQTCVGTYDYVDDFVPFIASELGLDAPQGLKYLWLDADDFSRSGCQPHVGGCAPGERAIGQAPGLLHELVHVVTGHHSMNRWPFFAEGLAVAYDPWDGDGLGPRYVFPAPGNLLLDPRPMMELPASDILYGTAGSFVSFLLSRHGPAPLVELLQRLDEPRTLEHLRQIFSDVYSQDLDAEVELFMNGTDCPDDPFPTLIYDCTMPEVVWESATRWRHSQLMDCAAGDLMGGIGPDRAWPSIRAVTLDVPTSGSYQLSASSDGEVSVQIGACFGCPWEPRYIWLEPGDQMTVDLDAGPYYVRMRAMSDEVPQIDLEVILTP